MIRYCSSAFPFYTKMYLYVFLPMIIEAPCTAMPGSPLRSDKHRGMRSLCIFQDIESYSKPTGISSFGQQFSRFHDLPLQQNLRAHFRQRLGNARALDLPFGSKAPGLLISRCYGRGKPAPSLFPVPSERGQGVPHP